MKIYLTLLILVLLCVQVTKSNLQLKQLQEGQFKSNQDEAQTDIEEEDNLVESLDESDELEDDEDEASEEEDDENGEEEDSDEVDDPGEITEIVTAMEREANMDDQRGLLPQIFGFLKGALTPNFSPTNSKSKQIQNKTKNQKNPSTKNSTKSHYGNPNNKFKWDDDYLPEDLNDTYFQNEILLDDIEAGVEESLLLSSKKTDLGKLSRKKNGSEEVENRQMTVYLFQGQYMAEPRLNNFIDGAIKNLRSEMRTSSMDPIYFRVLPRGRIIGRGKPIRRFPARKRRRRPVRGNKRRRRRRNRPIRRGAAGQRRRRRRRRPGQRRGGRRRRRRGPANRRRRAQNRRRKRKLQKKRNVGGGRVEGLSKVTRDGDAEMQGFGNYTLIRSHYNVGPIDIVMQFRTRRGLRRTGATMQKIKMHTVTRVSVDGCEMVDFLLDRPHPEMFPVKGRLFPLAQQVAKNLFSRLFSPDSFLVARIREKASLALLAQRRTTSTVGR